MTPTMKRLATCIGLVVLLGCGSRHDGPRLGAVLPLSGDTASYGKAAQRGIDLALVEATWNPKGEVLYEDDQGQTSKALSAMQKLISIDKVSVIMGSAGSSVTLAMCPIANRDKVVLISPISSAKDLTEKGGRFFFRVCPSDVVQASLMADWMSEDGYQKVAVVYINNSWGQGLQEEFRRRFSAKGGKILGMESCREGERDLRAQLTKLKELNPQAIYAITYGREGGALLRQARELGFQVPFYGADVWGSPELQETAGDAAKGVKIIVPKKLEGRLYSDFAASFRKKYGEEPDVYAAYAYDMAQIVVKAASTGKRGDDLRKLVAATVYDGVTGTIRFDSHGDVIGKGFERKTL
jgi:branched-chain amino acid transport system substrate-binding protein